MIWSLSEEKAWIRNKSGYELEEYSTVFLDATSSGVTGI
jgi:hypothetical protein